MSDNLESTDQGAEPGKGSSPTASGNSQSLTDDARKSRNWAMACHLSALALVTSIPFANIIAPLVIWLLLKKDYPEVDEAGRESLNFQITMTGMVVIAALSILIGIGIILLPIVLIADIVFIVIASVKTANGESYRYPFNIRLIN